MSLPPLYKVYDTEFIIKIVKLVSLRG